MSIPVSIPSAGQTISTQAAANTNPVQGLGLGALGIDFESLLFASQTANTDLGQSPSDQKDTPLPGNKLLHAELSNLITVLNQEDLSAEDLEDAAAQLQAIIKEADLPPADSYSIFELSQIPSDQLNLDEETLSALESKNGDTEKLNFVDLLKILKPSQDESGDTVQTSVDLKAKGDTEQTEEKTTAEQILELITEIKATANLDDKEQASHVKEALETTASSISAKETAPLPEEEIAAQIIAHLQAALKDAASEEDDLGNLEAEYSLEASLNAMEPGAQALSTETTVAAGSVTNNASDAATIMQDTPADLKDLDGGIARSKWDLAKDQARFDADESAADDAQHSKTDQSKSANGQNAPAAKAGQQNGEVGITSLPLSPLNPASSPFIQYDAGLSSLETSDLPQGYQSQNLQSLTNPVLHSQSAGSSHPTTQNVAIMMNRIAAQGKDTTIRVELSPPDLGKIEIDMQFSKEKTLKTVVKVEKPESYMMLQRDAHVLEKALADAGIEAAGSELSFELAQDDQSFSQDGRHDSDYHQGSNANSANSEDPDVTYSQMTWNFDPASGHTHYSILA